MSYDLIGESRENVPSSQLPCSYWMGALPGDVRPSPFLVYIRLCLHYNKWTCSIRPLPLYSLLLSTITLPLGGRKSQLVRKPAEVTSPFSGLTSHQEPRSYSFARGRTGSSVGTQVWFLRTPRAAKGLTAALQADHPSRACSQTTQFLEQQHNLGLC